MDGPAVPLVTIRLVNPLGLGHARNLDVVHVRFCCWVAVGGLAPSDASHLGRPAGGLVTILQ